MGGVQPARIALNSSNGWWNFPARVAYGSNSFTIRTYHSKYNPIERCWAALEQFWNGAILDSVETTLQWASNLRWKGIY